MVLRCRRAASPWASPRGATRRSGTCRPRTRLSATESEDAHLNMHILSCRVGSRGDEIDGHFLVVIDDVRWRGSYTWAGYPPVVALTDRRRGVFGHVPSGVESSAGCR